MNLILNFIKSPFGILVSFIVIAIAIVIAIIITTKTSNTSTSSNKCTSCPVGPIGKIGPKGPIGTKGQIGPIGPTGTKGQIGPIGPTGPIGPKGTKGQIGQIGPTGPIGPKGQIGPTGPSSSNDNDNDNVEKWKKNFMSEMKSLCTYSTPDYANFGIRCVKGVGDANDIVNFKLSTTCTKTDPLWGVITSIKDDYISPNSLHENIASKLKNAPTGIYIGVTESCIDGKNCQPELCVAHEGHCITSYLPLTNSYTTYGPEIPTIDSFNDSYQASNAMIDKDFWMGGFYNNDSCAGRKNC